MLKIIYRIIILIAIFIASLSYFSRDIKEVVFDLDNTTVMSDATFPLVTIKTGENQINQLHGYSSNLAANKIRESVTPLNFDKTLQILISQEDYNIKKLNYEVREFVTNTLIEEGSVSVFEEEGEYKKAKMKFMTDLELEKEYALKITLITSESKKMYYYQRVKIYENAHLKEKIDFILDFHNAIMDKATAETIIKYLEPSSSAKNTTLAYVNINSSFDLISWGAIAPTIITEIIPTVKEIYEETASVELNYYIQAQVAGATEQYKVTEFYRIRYSTDRMYLLSYERTMDALFDIKLASITKSQLKLGITNELEVPFLATVDKTKLAFVRNKELWFYNLEDNQITKVFSFRQEQTDYLRELYDQHDIRILNMDAEGNLEFMVYGYMNRGQYEGRVAIILYRFIRAENRIEELIYIPIEEPYQTLKENLGTLSYVNSNEVFYFNVYNTIYSYNFITRKLSEIAADINNKQVAVLKDINYVAWQENSNPQKAKNIYIMNMETGNVDTISSNAGYRIRLMDLIDSNLIYGFVSEGDIASMMDGSIMAPLSVVEIASVDKIVLKSYSKPGYYIAGLAVKENIVELKRVRKVNDDGRDAYVLAPQDYIMNQVKAQQQLTDISSRVAEQTLTEYYMTLPPGFIMQELPKVSTTVSTVISEDPTIRLPNAEQTQRYYYPYITGGIEGAYENAADAIEIAKARFGVVLSNNNQLVWERGVKDVKKTLTEFESMTFEASTSGTVENCIKLMLSYQGIQKSKAELSTKKSSAYEVFQKHSRYTPIRLTGVTLEDVLYYVSEGRPVMAFTDVSDALIIYGYDGFNILVVDPSDNKLKKMGIQDSAQMFSDAGNVFISYLEQ